MMLPFFAAPRILASEPEGEDRAQGTRRDLSTQKPGEVDALLAWAHATGDWGGARGWLEEHGIDFEVFLTSDGSILASGGAHPGRTGLRGLFDITLSVETDRLIGLAGGLLFADLQVQRGRDGSLDSGDFQVYSNIDAEDRTQLAEIWYEQALFGDTLLLKVGKSDANADFAYVENGRRFIHSSPGFSPTILNFPSYPEPAFGAQTFLRPGAGLSASLGVYDGALQSGVETGRTGAGTFFGAPADLFLVAEVGWSWLKDEEGAVPGRVGIGIWRNTGELARFDGGTQEGAQGYYLVLDQKLWANGDGADEEGIGAYLQYGWADPVVSPVEHHIGAGLQWKGAFASRPKDFLGVGGSWVDFTNARAAGLQGGELALEVFYGLYVAPWLSVKPDVQWIDNPGGMGRDAALILMLRTEITF